MTADFKQGTTLAGKVLVGGQLATTTETAVYTVPANSAVKIASASITNISASAVVVSAAVVPSGGTMGDGTHKVLFQYTLAVGDTISHKDVLSALDGAFLDAGAAVALTAGTASALDYVLTGAVSA